MKTGKTANCGLETKKVAYDWNNNPDGIMRKFPKDIRVQVRNRLLRCLNCPLEEICNPEIDITMRYSEEDGHRNELLSLDIEAKANISL